MAIIVTGGAGFIGSNFLNMMVPRHGEERFVNVDKLTYAGNHANVIDLESLPNYTFVQGDICGEGIERLVGEGDTIINFAAESHVDRSISSGDDFVRTNINGTHNLLEIARKKKAGRFVQISTDEVYGSLGLDAHPSKESDILNPSSPYSASKAAAEMLCISYHKTYGLPVIITRSSNNYGSMQHPEKIIPKFITNLIDGEKVPLMHSPENPAQNVRDWLYVGDNCRAIDLVMRKGTPGEIYNIGGGNELSNAVLTRWILKGMGAGEDMVEHVDHRAGHDMRYALDCTKIKRELGWAPEVTFANGLKGTIRWYKENESLWRPLKK